MFLAIDIGGTKVAVATMHVGAHGLRLGHVSRFHSDASASLLDMIRNHCGGSVPPLRGVGIGVAGPVLGRRVRLTNVAWEIDADALQAELHAPVYVVNDLVAHGYAVPHLPAEVLVPLQAGERDRGPAVLIAAGTGLGEAVLVWQSEHLAVLPSEGGHATFAPVEAEDLALAGFLMERYGGHVSWERVVSGLDGFRNLFDFLHDRVRPASPDLLAKVDGKADIGAVIVAAAQAGEPFAELLLRHFVRLYGAEAGNLALKVVATGGVYIAGGIAPKILPQLQSGEFIRGLTAKGRFQGLLSRLPVHVITEPNVALLGAAHYAAAATRFR